MNLKRILPLLIAILLAPFLMNAQVTTGTIVGNVTSDDGQSLPGATITAIHMPTGSKYNTVVQNNGQFTIPNVRIGGPYTIEIQSSGHTNKEFKDIYVSLGSPLSLDVTLNRTSTELSTVVVTANAKGNVISSDRSGTSTYISKKQLENLPSINRSVQDFARLTPQVKAGTAGNDGSSTGLSFAGQSNRFNQFSIDGANASDAFGLGSSGTNGGQANINPISMETIQEIQVVLSPYDVSQGGFTGGGINAVTKSGTNKFHGSVFGQYQDATLVGKSVRTNDEKTAGIERIPYGKFKNQTFGASIGGPIIKNKLFFFASAERYEKTRPVDFDPTQAGSGSLVSVDTLQKIKDFMQKTYNFDLGSFGAINNKNESTSFFGRIDWNISDKHRLTIRHNYVNGSNQIRSRSATSPLFENTGYKFTDVSNSSVLELNSTFNSSASNVLRLTYNVIRDSRSGPQAPNLSITNFDNTFKVNNTFNLGSEYSSAVNALNQDVFSITDNFTLYKGSHTLTFGTNNEFFKSENFFLQGFYGAYTYNLGGSSSMNITNWMNNTGMTQYQVGYSTSGRGDKAVAALKAAQFSVYGQDVWSITPKFKLTYGLRIDLPYIANKPAENPLFNTDFAAKDVRTNQMPDRKLMYSPRAGFNWDVEGDSKMQIRGGLGLFTGRIPFVWISNQMSNTGISTKNLSYNAAAIATNNITYQFDPKDAQLGAFIPGSTSPAPTVINVIDKNFKFPQVFRTNLGVDKKLGAGFIGTLEVIYTKTINNPLFTNINLSENGDDKVTIGSTVRPHWKGYVDPNFTQVIKMENTSKGASFNFTAQIQKPFTKGWGTSIAYNYGLASSLNDLPSSVALSNWRGAQSVNGLNNLELSNSNFNAGSRVSGYISKEFKYFGNLATTLTLFYNGSSGQNLTYVYSRVSGNSVTGDDAGGGFQSLAYVPSSLKDANLADIKNGATASQQWADFQEIAKSNKYLQDNLGQNVARNGSRLPWENHFDFRISQDFAVKSFKLQVFCDVLNIGALFSEKFGNSYGYGSNPDGFYPLTFNLFTPVIGNQTQDGVAITPNVNKPAFQFFKNDFTKIGDDYRPYRLNNFTSRWSSQVGVRLNF
ncbi:MAG: TonB-dependent receptor [Ginsengibacter sp.]